MIRLRSEPSISGELSVDDNGGTKVYAMGSPDDAVNVLFGVVMLLSAPRAFRTNLAGHQDHDFSY